MTAQITIATWNVNSVKARLMHLLDWLKRDAPDIVLLQELKCVDEAFPRMEVEELGYNLALHGEKTYNGVAILSKFPLSDIARGLPGDDGDTQARYIEAVASIGIRDKALGIRKENKIPNPQSLMPNPCIALRIASVYVPNGQDAASDKFQYKLRFLDRLFAHVKTLLAYDEALVIGGDYNIAPADADVHDPKAWEGSVLTHDEVRRRFRKIAHMGMYDAAALRGSHDYTWWDYRAGALARNDGLRIDHLMLSPQAADRLEHYGVKKDVREQEKASDHAPVMVALAA